jgi:hypothetical protein
VHLQKIKIQETKVNISIKKTTGQFVATSSDPRFGTNQTNDEFWRKVKEEFDAINTRNYERAQSSLRDRFDMLSIKHTGHTSPIYISKNISIPLEMP